MYHATNHGLVEMVRTTDRENAEGMSRVPSVMRENLTRTFGIILAKRGMSCVCDEMIGTFGVRVGGLEREWRLNGAL
jgi:hypothetical protein